MAQRSFSSAMLSTVLLSCLWSICRVDAGLIPKDVIFEKGKHTESFSMDAIYIQNSTRDFHRALKKAYGRYSIDPTLPVPVDFRSKDWKAPSTFKTSSLSRRKEGSVVSTSYGGDAEYISSISVGGQKIRVALDSGSADLWMFADTLPTRYPGHKYYSSSKSKTYQPMSGSSWYITYADGTYAGGQMAWDTVKVGTSSVKSMAIGLAETVSDGYINDPHVDGVLGLSFSTINTVRPNQVATFFEAAIPSLKKQVFTVTLKRQASGSYDFGYVDPKKYTGTLKYVKVFQDSGYWQVWNTAFQVAGQKKMSEPGTYGILDTGTSLLLLSDAAAAAYWAQVSGARYDDTQAAYIFPCSSALPDFSIMLGSGSSKIWLKIPGTLMNYGYITTDGLTCYGGLQSRGNSDINIIGDVFMKAFFVVFDKAKSRAGFAAQA